MTPLTFNLSFRGWTENNLRWSTPAVVNDIDDLAGDKVHDDESVFIFITDIEIYLIYGYIFRQGKPGKIHIAFEDQACAGIGDIELGSDIRCRSGKVPESIENEIGSDIGGMRIFIQERKGIVLRMSARFTDPSALMDDQIDVHGILGNGMIDPAGINALGMHAGITRRTEVGLRCFSIWINLSGPLISTWVIE